MPWDHINNVINRSLPLKQPSKTASSHSSICINSRHRSPGLRKPHLLPSCFYLSLRCISCRDCKVRKAGKLFVPLRLPNSDQEIKPRASPRAPVWYQVGRRTCPMHVPGQARLLFTSSWDGHRWGWELGLLFQLLQANQHSCITATEHTEDLTSVFLTLPMNVSADSPKTLVFSFLASQIPDNSSVTLLLFFCCYRDSSHILLYAKS